MSETPVSSVSVVIPVYNEEESLGKLHEELNQSAHKLPHIKFEFIFVNDGSKDKSLEVLKTLSTNDPRVRTISFKRNFGQTAAMSCGIKASRGDIIIPMDADLQNDPADVPRFLEKINEGYSCVSGWRKDRKDDLVLRKLPSWTANALISIFTGVSLHDYGCSMKAYKRDIIQGVQLYGEMHRFIPAYASWQGARVTEIVVNHRARQFGVSKYGISRIFKVVLDLLVVKFLTKYFNKPMHFFGFCGFIAFAIGCLALFVAIVLRLVGYASLIQTPLPVLGFMSIVVGFQFILFGLMAEVQMRTFYESQSRMPYEIGSEFGTGLAL